MAWLESHGDGYRICFRLGGRQVKRRLQTTKEKEAARLLGVLEDTLARVELGRLIIPEDADPVAFLMSGGDVRNVTIEVAETLGKLIEKYQKEVTNKETNTIYTEKMHLSHLKRIIGARTSVREITAVTVQHYIDARSKEPGRRGTVSHVTIKKEVTTLSTLWRWADAKGLVGALPRKGLRYQKTKEKSPFQTWQQIVRQIKRGGSKELWESVYLMSSEITDLLEHVKAQATVPWLYPMFVCAAHTGMRRSELIRSEAEDFDFEAGLVKVREKKKDRSKQVTFRHVPMSDLVRSVMRAYLKTHPDSPSAFVTGPKGDQSRPARQTVVAAYKSVLEGSKWAVLPGWHTLRHSFISNCASQGVDQRFIDSWAGHQTEEMSRRYRHLLPDAQQQELKKVF